jgi:hypothetical protein
VFPGFTGDDTPNRCLTDPKLSHQNAGFAVYIKRSDSNNVGFGQFCAVMTLSMSQSALCDGILRILFCGTQEKVNWPHALFYIAAMTNEQVFGNWSVMKFPGKPVRGYLTMRPEHDRAIPSIPSPVAGGPSPQPTGIGFIDLSPKTVRDRFAFVKISAFSATELSGIFAFAPWPGLERLAAMLTYFEKAILRWHLGEPLFSGCWTGRR